MGEAVAEMVRRKDAWANVISLYDNCITGHGASVADLALALQTALESGVRVAESVGIS